MDRSASFNNLASRDGPWEIAVIGGGATGVGIAVDAASRGYAVCLLEQSDFGKGTSSRSTKLVHGGVRYLQQGNIGLVKEALRERGFLRRNAPHLVHDLPFIVPNYSWWEAPFYGLGMKLYDLLSGKFGFGKSQLLSREEVLAHIPTLEQNGLRGGVLYHDGQFDDSRLLIDLAHTATSHGAVLLNYAQVTKLRQNEDGIIDGLEFVDAESGEVHALRAKCVINATGAFSDVIRQMDDATVPPIVVPSQGVHLVLDRSFLPGDAAIMVPRTSDGRVMFAIPWLGHTLLGTTDTPIAEAILEPIAQEQEIDFILETAGKYLSKRPTRQDILSIFAGIRPLVRTKDAANTAALARDHTILVSKSQLVTIAGGKWTTYRKMAEDCMDHAIGLAKLEPKPCVTATLAIHGHQPATEKIDGLAEYGSVAARIQEIVAEHPELGWPLHHALPNIKAEVIWAVRQEMARTVEDILARRMRALFLNARAAMEMAPETARLMALELNRAVGWQEEQVQSFNAIAAGYVEGFKRV